MKIMPGSKRHHYPAIVGIFLLAAAFITGIVGCSPIQYQLTISSTEGGSVINPGEGIFTYYAGRTANLIAEAKGGYGFRKWTGDVGTIADVSAAAISIIVNGNYSITANFATVIEIWDWCDLDAIRDNPSGFYLLMNDLDSNTANYTGLASMTANQGKGWQPIGGFNYTFTGTFDGQGYEIRDLFINRPDEDLVGVFGGLDEGGRIEDLGVVNASVIGDRDVAGLVGDNWGTVSHCYFTGSVTGIRTVGGLVGKNFGTVSNSYSTSSVTSTEGSVGGLVGSNEGYVTNSYSTGSVTGISAVGGLVGADWYGGVTASYCTGNVTGIELVGGLVGIIQGSYVTDSYSSGSVTGEENVGGLVGYRWETTVSNSFWDTETSGQSTSDGGTGKTTSEIQDIATFSGAGWNIVTVANPGTRNPSYIWNIVDAVTYPFLSWQP